MKSNTVGMGAKKIWTLVRVEIILSYYEIFKLLNILYRILLYRILEFPPFLCINLFCHRQWAVALDGRPVFFGLRQLIGLSG